MIGFITNRSQELGVVGGALNSNAFVCISKFYKIKTEHDSISVQYELSPNTD